ncbi:MAG: RadC family protein [Bacillota bacterium]|jgi:DNA repair protein RadC
MVTKEKLKVVEYRCTIKEMPAECRPRERLFQKGADALSNGELLAIIMRTGTTKDTALELANQLLSKGGLKFLADASLEELKQFSGVGEAKAAEIKAVIELGKRMVSAGNEIMPAVRSPQDAAHIMMEEMRFLDREHFKALLLNTKNQLFKVITVSIGSLSSTIVHPRELFKDAIKSSAAALILIHNHPSGDPTPSREDIEVTKRLIEVGGIVGIEVLDHIIIGNGQWMSLKEKNFI